MSDSLNFQITKEGFGSYLSGILPDDIAVTAGAFSATMQQIRNIRNVDFEKFSQVAVNIESTKGLPQVNGTNVPTNTNLSNAGFNLTALGSGPYGTYTMSDFLGCMSGLPYSWGSVQSMIQTLQTTTLTNLYKNLYLAVTWKVGTVSVQYTNDGFGNYTVTGITLTDQGGGYGREGAASPNITLSNGGTGITTIGTNPDDLSTYGRILSVSLTSSGSVTGSVPTATVANPPTTYGSAGWPGMNTAVQYYIDASNAEIASIKAANPTVSSNLNTMYNSFGKQLTIEQRSRYTGINPVPSPTRDTFINRYPISIYSFVDAIPILAQNTLPHMYAQTLEAISDLNTPGGQSIVAMMRQERNAARLQQIGIDLDNNISGKLDQQEVEILTANGTLPTGVEGVTVTGINGNVNNPSTTFTLPSNFTTQPIGYFDPNTTEFKLATVQPTSPIQQILNTAQNNINNNNLLGPAGNGTGPAQPAILSIGPATSATGPAISSISPISTGISKPSVNPKPGLVSAILEPGPAELQPIAIITSGPISQGTPLDKGGPAVPGSLAGSPASNIIPPNLNTALTASVLLPSVYDIAEAIEEVIMCNCDCWIN
jgi:hypothetical protein